MPKFCLFLWMFLGFAGGVWAQQDPIVMRVNGDKMTRSDFEYAYNHSVGKERKSLDAFVDSLVNFRLKVSAAEKAGLDTLQSFRKEQIEYRRRLAKSYLVNEKIQEEQAVRLYTEKGFPLRETVWISQVFKHIPQSASSFRIRDVSSLLDSVYMALKSNPQIDFSSLVEKYSDVKETLPLNRLQAPEEIEKVAFTLQEGEVSQPFFSPQGMHVVKVVRRKADMSLEDARQEITIRLSRQQATEASDLVRKLKERYRYSPDKTGLDELMAKGATDKPLFTLDGRIYTGTDFARFAEGYARGGEKQYEAFVTKTVLDYEHAHLEQKYPEFGWALKKYRDSVLVAEITSREIGEPARKNESGLVTYFDSNKSDYRWDEPRFRGVLLHSVDKKTIKLAKRIVKKFPEQEWEKALQRAFNTPTEEIVKVEQGLFAKGSNRYVDKLVFKEGQFEPLKSHPFTAVIGEKQKGPETLEEVRKQVSSDYSAYLEKRWMEQLRAGGKVEINEEVLKTVNNH